MKRKLEDIDGWPMKRVKISADGSEAIYHCLLRQRDHGCHGSFAVNLQNPSSFRIIRQHSRHDRDGDFLEAERGKQQLKELSSTKPAERPRNLIDEVRRNMTATSANMLGNYDSMRKTICRARPVDVEKEKVNAQDPEFTGRFSKNLDNGRFLLWDTITQPLQQRIVIYASDNCLQVLSRSSIVMADGTFDTAPDPFMQLVTLHCEVIKGVMRPVAFILLQSKETSMYHMAFQYIKQHPLLTNWRPRYIIVDFEMSLRNSLKLTFPTADVSGCYFHLLQSWRRRAELLRIYSDFLPGQILRQTWLLLKALPFCSPVTVALMFDGIRRNLPGPLCLIHEEFFSYVESNYIGVGMRPARFPIETWNCYRRTVAGIPRTTNAAESFHKLLSEICYRTFGLRKVKMSDVIDCIKKEEHHTLMDVAVLNVNPRAQINAKRKQCMVEKDVRLRDLLRNQVTSGPPLHGFNHLKAIAACIGNYQ